MRNNRIRDERENKEQEFYTKRDQITNQLKSNQENLKIL
jgi:hypothetical protein